MTEKAKKERMLRIVEELKLLYPDAECALEYAGDPWRLLVMGRLSAQCTDARVNLVCRDLFRKYPDARSMADADINELGEAVKSCGLYRTKAQNLKDASRMLVEEYDGILPDTMEELLKFPGVGRKIANLLLGDVFHKSAVVTDTHCIRICGRFGAYPETEKNPAKIEKILIPLLPPEESSDFCHRIVWFGRERCKAPNPKCEGCPIGDKGLCEHRNRALKAEEKAREKADGKAKN